MTGTVNRERGDRLPHWLLQKEKSMQTIPVDTNGFTNLLVNGEVRATTEFGTDTPSIDKDTGFPVYSVELAAFTSEGIQTINVKVPLAQSPTLNIGQTVRVTGLVARAYRSGDRVAYSFKAKTIEATKSGDTPKAAN
jgi:hypothetical protein